MTPYGIGGRDLAIWIAARAVRATFVVPVALLKRADKWLCTWLERD